MFITPLIKAAQVWYMRTEQKICAGWLSKSAEIAYIDLDSSMSLMKVDAIGGIAVMGTRRVQ